MCHYIVILSHDGRYIFSGPHSSAYKAIWLAYHKKWNTVLYVVNVKLKEAK